MPDQELVDRVTASTGLPPSVAARVIEDVVAYYREPVAHYVRRRHARLRVYGRRNDDIYPQLAAEVGDRVFAGPALTQRQLRRIIYG